MRKLALILIAGLAGFAVAPVVVHAKDSSGETSKKTRPFAAEEQAVRDAEKALKAAQKSGKPDDIAAAKKQLEDARKALSDAKKAARKARKSDSASQQ